MREEAMSDMKSVLSSFCTGVAVITACGADGRPVGMAVQSFSSVSLDPPLVCFCPARTSTTWPRIQAAGAFAVNILAADQQELCRRFAVTGGDKFAGVPGGPAATARPCSTGSSPPSNAAWRPSWTAATTPSRWAGSPP